MKEKLCYVGYNIHAEQKLAQETTFLVEQYTLPDGRVIKVALQQHSSNLVAIIYFLGQSFFFLWTLCRNISDQVGGERFEASEALFQPHLINKEGQGNDEMMIKCDQSEQLWSTKSEEVRTEFESLTFNREEIKAIFEGG